MRYLSKYSILMLLALLVSCVNRSEKSDTTELPDTPTPPIKELPVEQAIIEEQSTIVEETVEESKKVQRETTPVVTEVTTIVERDNYTPLSHTPTLLQPAIVTNETLPHPIEVVTQSHITAPVTYSIDRTADEVPFALKGEWMGGLSASTYNFEAENATLLLLLNSIEASGNITSVKPYVGYFYADNRCVGLRWGYTHYDGVLELAELDLGESNDISMTLPNLSLNSNRYNYAIFHRSYTSLDSKGRFGLFSDVECSFSHGTNSLSYTIDNDTKVVDSRQQSVEILFNPGVAFYLFPNVSTSLSFGMGGFTYSRIEQLDEQGETMGWYENSGLSFKFNILAINFGITFHFW